MEKKKASSINDAAKTRPLLIKKSESIISLNTKYKSKLKMG